jgi:AraC-like DNA-binding protein
MLSVESSKLGSRPSDVGDQSTSEGRAATGKTMLTGRSGIDRLYQMGHRETALFPNMQSPLPALMYGAGFQEENTPTYDWDGCKRGTAELAMIQYTLSGRGRLRFQDRDMVVEPGQAMLLHFPHKHRYWIQEGERWEFFYVMLSGADAVREIRQITEKIGPLITLAESSPALELAANACAMALEGKIDSPYRSSELAWSIVMGLEGESAIDAGYASPPVRAIPSFVLDVEKFCQLNLARPIGVDDMARVAKMSRFHFSRRFEKARGISPGRYLASLRLEEAMRLIASHQFTVKKVAEECGFGDANYFCKVFRKSFGVSPGAYRNSGA